MYTHSTVSYNPFPLPSPLEIQFFLQLGNLHILELLGKVISTFLLPMTCPSAGTQINPTVRGRASTP